MNILNLNFTTQLESLAVGWDITESNHITLICVPTLLPYVLLFYHQFFCFVFSQCA